MTEHADLISDLDHEDAFEVQMRGYSRHQVDDYVTRSRRRTRELEERNRDLEERLSRAIDEMERVRQSAAGKPAHEEVSERVGQILKLADDEAKAQRMRAQEDIAKLREEAKQDADRVRAEARDQTERMLTAAQEQAENAIAQARAEADKLRNAARTETERAVTEAHKKAENTVASATAQAKQMLDEATTRATAIHDGAERRLNLLMSRHTETLRRLTEIRDVVTNLVASEVARGSLEDEVAKTVAAAGGGAVPAARGAAQEARHAPAPAARPAAAHAAAPDGGSKSPAAPARPGPAAQPAPAAQPVHAAPPPAHTAPAQPGLAAQPAQRSVPSAADRGAATRDDSGLSTAARPRPGQPGTADSGENVRVLPE
jgi:cell division septum initiation protein DivIVA